jgi:hypothetical protein
VLEPVPETEAVLREMLRYGDSELAVTLLQMGRRAKEIVPECVGLSLGLVTEGLTLTLAATADEWARLDAMQYLDGGPCVTVSDHPSKLDIDISDLLDEDKWRMFASASAAVGVASSLSLPILRGPAVVGGVNLYASTSSAFHGKHDALAQALGASAEGAIANADLSFTTRLAAAEAPQVYADRVHVDLAIGVVAAVRDVDIETAEKLLRQAAARAGITVGQAARTLRHIYEAG